MNSLKTLGLGILILLVATTAGAAGPDIKGDFKETVKLVTSDYGLQFKAFGYCTVARGGGARNAEVLRAKPPYQTWTKADLGRYLGGPLLAKWGTRYLVGGRKQTEAGPRMTLAWLIGDHLVERVELPSGGDNSYPGFVQLTNSTAWLSYYSSHEKDANGKALTAIYLANLRLED